MKLEHDKYGVFIPHTREDETYLPWDIAERLHKALGLILWERDTQIHNENIEQKS